MERRPVYRSSARSPRRAARYGVRPIEPSRRSRAATCRSCASMRPSTCGSLPRCDRPAGSGDRGAEPRTCLRDRRRVDRTVRIREVTHGDAGQSARGGRRRRSTSSSSRVLVERGRRGWVHECDPIVTPEVTSSRSIPRHRAAAAWEPTSAVRATGCSARRGRRRRIRSPGTCSALEHRQGRGRDACVAVVEGHRRLRGPAARESPASQSAQASSDTKVYPASISADRSSSSSWPRGTVTRDAGVPIAW